MVADADSRTLDVTAFFENVGLTRFHIWLLVLSSFVTLFDGLDFSLISFTIPYLRDELHLADAMMGYVTAAAFAGADDRFALRLLCRGHLRPPAGDHLVHDRRCGAHLRDRVCR